MCLAAVLIAGCGAAPEMDMPMVEAAGAAPVIPQSTTPPPPTPMEAPSMVMTQGSIADPNAGPSALSVAGVLPNQTADCESAPDPSVTPLTSGVLDVALRDDYAAWLLAGLEFSPELTEGGAAPSSADVVAMAYIEVQLRDSLGPVDAGHFLGFTSEFMDVPAAGSTTYQPLRATLISNTVAAALRTELEPLGPTARRTITAQVHLLGETLTDIPVESGEFTFNVDVCYGCLVDFPADALVTDATGNSVCSSNAAFAGASKCALGQDTMVDCRACSATVAACTTP